MKTFPRYLKTSLVLAALCCVGTANAADKSTLKHGDKSFVEDAAKSGMEEVAISQIAATKAMNPQVKEFAQMMVSDHTGANAKLTSLATTKNVMLPTKQPDTDKWTKKKAGNDFDQDYMAKMVSDHDDAVKLFDKESKKGDDADLKAFATETLPKLQAHQLKAKEIKKALK